MGPKERALMEAREARYGVASENFGLVRSGPVLAGKVSVGASGLAGKQGRASANLEFAAEVVEAVKAGADAGVVADMIGAAFARRGGRARADRLSPERRSEIARVAAKARHSR